MRPFRSLLQKGKEKEGGKGGNNAMRLCLEKKGRGRGFKEKKKGSRESNIYNNL